MSRVVVNEIQAKVGNDVTFNSNIANPTTIKGEGTATTNLQQGLAKYFINYAQGTDTVNKSLNSSTVTDASLGHFTLNYTNNFSDALYSLSTGIHDNTDDADTARGGHSLGFENGGTVNTASAQCNYCYGASNSAAAVDLDATNYILSLDELTQLLQYFSSQR